MRTPFERCLARMMSRMGHLLGLEILQTQDGGGAAVRLPAPDLAGVGAFKPALQESGGLRPVGVAPALQPDGDLRVREDGDLALSLQEVPQGGAVAGDGDVVLRGEAGLRLGPSRRPWSPAAKQKTARRPPRAVAAAARRGWGRTARAGASAAGWKRQRSHPPGRIPPGHFPYDPLEPTPFPRSAMGRQKFFYKSIIAKFR